MAANAKGKRRIVLNLMLDGLVSAAAAPLARWLAAPQGGLLHPLWFIAGGGITLLISGLPFRVPQQYWRFSGLDDLASIASASALSSLLFSFLIIGSGFALPTPTFPLIYALLLLVMLGAVRMTWRLVATRRTQSQTVRKVLLLGADHEADLYMRALARSAAPQRVVGILTNGTQQAGRRIHGSLILGRIEETGSVLDSLAQTRYRPDALVITDPTLRGAGLSELLNIARLRGLEILRTPTLTVLQPADQMELRPIALEDLLNRSPITLDMQGIGRLIAGRVIMVTGAGGSIGSELVRQIAAFAPRSLVLLENNEYALWQISLDVSERAPGIIRHEVLADIRDQRRISDVFAEYRPELVFHAAALKHVPLVEENPLEGLLTNVIGTRIVADAARSSGVQAMVLVSTDKAVNPSSLMGASKRCAEIYAQALDMLAYHKMEDSTEATMRCVTVRFGNVLGSTGSVVPLFRRQLEHGGPLTVTHPDMTRYFMTIPEAAGLVLQAAVRGTRPADVASEELTDRYLRGGGIFVLDMGDPVKIVDLAYQMTRLAGLEPGRDIRIEFTGLRPGEKLFEELFHGREAPVQSDMAGLLIAAARTVDMGDVRLALDRLEAACRADDMPGALAIVQSLVPEFAHNRDGSAGTLPSA